MSRKSNLTIEHLWSVFAEIETRENLVSWRVGSIFIWPLIRASLMREVAEKLGVFEVRPPQAKVADSPAADIAFAPSNYAVVPFVRRNSAGLDPFSTFIVDSLVAHGEKPLLLGMGPDDVGSGRPQVEQLEREFLSRYRTLAKLVVAPTLRKSHAQKYALAIAYLENVLAAYADGAGVAAADITGPYRSFPRWLLVDFWAQRRGWKKFFKTAGVRKVFIVNAWKRAMIAGAQAAGVTVVEPMHGAISGIHPYLSWPRTDSVAYQPDELLEWGEYWGDVANLPARTKRRVIGAPEFVTQAIVLEASLAKSGEAHQPNTVLIASQAHATQAITEFLLVAARANPEIVFTLKQHPQEAPADFGDSAPANLQLADPTANTFDLMARSEFVLGVYSTALFEALTLGCKVGVLGFSGWQHIRGLVDHGDATLIEDQTQLQTFFAQAKAGSASDYYYAKPASEAELWAAIKIAE